MNKKIEDKAIKVLEADTSIPKYGIERMDAFKKWLNDLYPNAESIKSVVVGCAVFRYKQQINKMTAKTKSEKLEAKYKIGVTQIYLDLANEYLNCVR